MKNQQSGLTLTSLLTAVALTGVLAVSASKLVVNQSKMAKVLYLIDQREAIARFYSEMMNNELAWKCTLYDTHNSSLLTQVISTTAASFSGAVELHTPDCAFEEKTVGNQRYAEFDVLTSPYGIGGAYRSSGSFFPTNPIYLADSLTEEDADGWWEVSLTGSGIAKGSVDLMLKMKFLKNKYMSAHGNFNPPDIKEDLEYRVRHSREAIAGGDADCGSSAVVAIGDLVGASVKDVSCSTHNLINVAGGGATDQGNVVLGFSSSAIVRTEDGVNHRSAILRYDTGLYPYSQKGISFIRNGGIPSPPTENRTLVRVGSCSQFNAVVSTDLGGGFSCANNAGPKGGTGPKGRSDMPCPCPASSP